MTKRGPGILLALISLFAFAASAAAEVGSIEGAGEWVPVWRSSSLIKEGQDLVNAGEYDLAAQRMVCLVDAGTRVTATFAGGVPTLDNTGYIGGFARIVVIEGPTKGCTGYLESMHVRGARAPAKPWSPASPCWMTKDEIAPIKTAVDAGNLTEAGELNQKVTARMKACQLSPCAMTNPSRTICSAA